MRIIYVTHTRFPTEKAHGFQVASVCNALAKLGNDVTLAAPTVWNSITRDAFSYYRIPETFALHTLAHFDALRSPLVPGFAGFALSMFFYRRALARFLAVTKADLLYTRSPLVLPALLATGIPVVLELHTLPAHFAARFVKQCNRCARVVCLTTPMRDALLAMGAEERRVIVEGDAVDTARFAHLPSPARSKVRWDLDDDLADIGYIGSLVTFNTLRKGVDDLIDAIRDLVREKKKVFGWVVGGPPAWREKYRKLASCKGLTVENIVFQDPIMPNLVADAMNACDVLVYTAPQSDHPYFQRDTSPLKLYEYLASGRPVVCADIPPVRDIADPTVVRFYQPGSGRSLAGAIMDVLEHPVQARERAKRAHALMEEHTWEKRMGRILGSL